MPVAARPAIESDLDALIALNRVVQQLHAKLYPDDFGPETDPAAIRTRFASLLTEPRHALAVAETDGDVVGYIWTEHQIRPASPFYNRRDRIMIHHISVSPDTRRQGVAAALFRHVEQRAANEGIKDIYLETWAANTEAHAFFTAQGFTHLKLMFRKRLG
jgi:ribosomal protein S18 acetylase RimI-like enzyme